MLNGIFLKLRLVSGLESFIKSADTTGYVGKQH